MGNVDLTWVDEIESIPTRFHSKNPKDVIEAWLEVNKLLREGWRLLEIVNDIQVVRTIGGSELQSTQSFFVLGRKKG